MVAEQDLADYSPFKVSDVEALTNPAAITSAQFLKYAALTRVKLDRDDPGLGAEEYDHAHALLIAHTIAAKAGALERTSERLDNYSYNKESGLTSFLVQYKAVLAEANDQILKPTHLVEHADRDNKSLDLDQAEVPELFNPEDVD